MDSTYNSRVKQLENLKELIEDTESKFASVLNDIGWTKEELLKNDIFTICPINSSHSVPINKVKNHVEICQVRSEGYTKNDVLFPVSFVTLDSSSAIVIDRDLQDEILRKRSQDVEVSAKVIETRLVPRTLDRVQSDLTADERVAIYEYVLQNTTVERIEDIDMNLSVQKDNKPSEKLYLQNLAEKRDLKRRRAKYRKPVGHGYKEELKNAINSQMEMLEEWIESKNGTKKQDQGKESSVHSAESKEERKEYKSRYSEFREDRSYHRGRSSYSSRNDKYSYGERNKDYKEKSEKSDRYKELRSKYGEFSGSARKSTNRYEEERRNYEDKGKRNSRTEAKDSMKREEAYESKEKRRKRSEYKLDKYEDADKEMDKDKKMKESVIIEIPEKSSKKDTETVEKSKKHKRKYDSDDKEYKKSHKKRKKKKKEKRHERLASSSS